MSGMFGSSGRRPSGCDLGRAIRELRKQRSMTIEGLAFASDVHPTYLSSIERGRRNPSWEKLCAIASGLDVEIVTVVRRAESAERVRRGLERVLAEERTRMPQACVAPVISSVRIKDVNAPNVLQIINVHDPNA